MTHRNEYPYQKITDLWLFLIIFVGISLWRFGYVPVWDDTNIVIDHLLFPEYQNNYLGIFTQSAQDKSGYRPVAMLLKFVKEDFFLTASYPFFSYLLVLFSSTLIGITAILLRRLTLYFCHGDEKTSYLAVIFFLGATPVVQSNWMVLASNPILLPLFTITAVLFHLKHKKTPLTFTKSSCFIFLCLLFTWYREAYLLVVTALVAIEFLETRTISKKLILYSTSALICAFPTLLPWAGYGVQALYYSLTYSLIFNETASLADFGPKMTSIFSTMRELSPVPSFTIGSIDKQIGGSINFKEEVSHHALSIFSPTMLLFLFMGFVLTVLSKSYKNIKKTKATLDYSILFFGTVFFLACIYFGIDSSSEASSRIYTFGMVALMLLLLRQHASLFIIGCAFLFPFYFVYTERVHLSYLCVPVAIGLSCVFRTISEEATMIHPLRAKFVRFFVICGLVAGIIDSASNFYSVQKVMVGVSDGIKTAAKALDELPVTHKKIISNVIHVGDFRLFYGLGNSERTKLPPSFYLTVRAGHGGSIPVVDHGTSLSDLLSNSSTDTTYYFLDAQYNRTEEKRHYHSHGFLRGCLVNTINPKIIAETLVKYPIFDPLRYFENRRYYAFLGPPDLQDDFYFGPSDDFLFAEVNLKYILHEITSKKISSYNQRPFAKVLMTDKNGRSLFYDGEVYYLSTKRENASNNNVTPCAVPLKQNKYYRDLTKLLVEER